MKLQIEANGIYKPLWQTRKRYVITMGGRGAGRSYETSQKVIAGLVQTKRPFRAALMRAIHQDIRHSNWQELLDRVSGWDIGSTIKIADSTMEMERGKNSVHAHGFKRSSSDRTAKLKSLASYTDAFIEEAEEIGEDEFMQLDDSLRADGSQIHLSLNTPAKSHWIIKRFFNLIPIVIDGAPLEGYYRLELKPEVAHDVEFIFSDHTNNPYIAQAVHDRYEAYRLTKPAYYWQMIRGFCPEVVRGRIYTNWTLVDTVPREARLVGRWLDFGYTNDPTSIGDVYEFNGGYILDEIAYTKGLLNHQIAAIINGQPKAVVIADSAEPKSIAELKLYDIPILPSTKGADSIVHGIQVVQAQPISVTRRSVKTIEESENYAWLEDKDGKTLNRPKPGYDHSMDGIRYVITFLNPAASTEQDKQTEEDEDPLYSQIGV